MSFGFECGDGWFNLIYDLSKELSKQDPSCIVVQVKEKFGGLRFYVNGVSEKGWNIIAEYELKSHTTCEYCGAIGRARSGNWIKTLCNKCYIKREIRKFIDNYIWRIKYSYIKIKRLAKGEKSI